jgi:hypothetical protein
MGGGLRMRDRTTERILDARCISILQAAEMHLIVRYLTAPLKRFALDFVLGIGDRRLQRNLHNYWVVRYRGDEGHGELIEL